MSGEGKSDTVVSHLGEIIKGRYGRNIEVVRLTNLRSGDSIFLTEQWGSEIHIPLSYGELFLGKAVLRGDSMLSSIEVDRASETVKMALEPVLYGEYLDLQETNQKAQVTNKKIDIRPAFLRVIGPDGGPQIENEDSESEHGSSKSNFFASILFIEGENPEFVRRVAQDIHEQSESWSFVELRNLIGSRCNLESELGDLESLGMTTIFISAAEFEVPEIKAWVGMMNGKKHPSLILIHRDSSSAKDFLEGPEIPVVSADRLPAHRLLRIETLQMMFKRECRLDLDIT